MLRKLLQLPKGGFFCGWKLRRFCIINKTMGVVEGKRVTFIPVEEKGKGGKPSGYETRLVKEQKGEKQTDKQGSDNARRWVKSETHRGIKF